MSFTTLDNVALYLNKLNASELTPLETAQITALILQVDGLIQNYCGWHILAKDYTNKKYNGNGTTTIDLEAYPLISVTSVTMDGEVITPLIVTSDDEGYLVTNDASSFTKGTNNIIATYRAGFENATIPSELTYAATYLVVLNYQKIINEMFGIKNGKVDAVDVTFESSNLPTLVQNVLNQYMLVVVR